MFFPDTLGSGSLRLYLKAMVVFCFEIITVDSENWLTDALSDGHLH